MPAAGTRFFYAVCKSWRGIRCRYSACSSVRHWFMSSATNVSMRRAQKPPVSVSSICLAGIPTVLCINAFWRCYNWWVGFVPPINPSILLCGLPYFDPFAFLCRLHRNITTEKCLALKRPEMCVALTVKWVKQHKKALSRACLPWRKTPWLL